MSDFDFWALCDKNRIVCVKKPYHVVFMILNFCLPGTGTMLSAFARFQEHPPDTRATNWQVFVDGILQQYLSILIFGYVWSCWTGYWLYKKSKENK